MRRLVLLLIGGIATLMGLVWTLQGLGILGGSSMSGDKKWALIGPVVAIIGLIVLFRTLSTRRPT